jgi:outer membrane lipoprotein-sorting protein
MKIQTLILILTASVLSACTSVKIAGPGTSSSAAAHTDPRAEVINASHKFIALHDVAGHIQADGDTPFDQQVEFVAPDRYHVHYHDQAGAEAEMIIIGNDTFIRSGDSWNKISGEDSPTPTLRNSFTDDVLESVSDAHYEGEENVGDKPAYVYTYKLVTKVGNFPVTQKIWVAEDSGIPMKSYVVYPNGGIKTLTTTYDTVTPEKVEPPDSISK